MFKGWTFNIDKGVNPSIREIINKHEGDLTENKQNATCCLVDVDYVVGRNKFEMEKNAVLAHWVAACHIRDRMIDQRMYRIVHQDSEPDEDRKRSHATPYSKQEDQTLLDFAEAHEEAELTQEKLWALAEEEGILERNAISMLQRYRSLK